MTEDTKSDPTKTEAYRLRAKLFAALFGRNVSEVMKQRPLLYAAEDVAIAAEAYLQARCYRIGNKAKAFEELRRALNRWRPRLKRPELKRAA